MIEAILSDEKVVKRRSTKRRSTKRRSKVRLNKKRRRSTKRRSAKKRGMLFGSNLQIDSFEELNNVPDEELNVVFPKLKPEQIKNEINLLISARGALDIDSLIKLGVLHQLRNYYNKKPESVVDLFGKKLTIKPKNDNKAREFMKKATKQNEESIEELAKRLVYEEASENPENIFNQPVVAPKRKSLRKSLSHMVNMMISNKRNAVRLPPNALEGISAGDDGPKTPEAALEKLKAAARAARGSVRPYPDDDETV